MGHNFIDEFVRRLCNYCLLQRRRKKQKYRHKITNQRFDIDYIREQIKNILSYQSDALHWNLVHVNRIGQIGQKSLESYAKISKKLKVEMHSSQSVEKRIAELFER